jgi:hypothetical protein
VLHVFDVSDALVNHIRANFPQDVAIIACYGSYVHGTATSRSDLDFFFIPAAPAGYKASVQFIIDDISFDFWPISWERAERMAALQEPFTSIIADCRLLYVRSEEDRERFMGLRDTICAHTKPEQLPKLIEKGEADLRNVYVHLYKLSRADAAESITFFRTEAYGVLTKVLQIVALLNQTFYTKGFGKNKEQIAQLPIKPKRLDEHMRVILYSDIAADIVQACEQLTEDTLERIEEQKEKRTRAASYPNAMEGFFEEEKGVLDKIITACERNDYETAFFNAIHAQDEIARLMYFAETGHWPSSLAANLHYQHIYKREGLTELVALLNPHNLAPLQQAVQQLSERLEQLLKSRGVEIHRFQTVDQFKSLLNLFYKNV